MKKALYSIFILIIALTSCKDDDNKVFEKTADERVAEAIGNLKNDLVAPPNGWKLKYRPETESGSFYVLLDFNNDNTVTIKSDLGANDGEYFEQTITYRIDNSMGLELIMENYSFFSFLFEQDQATFGAEYEFNFINKTPDNALVFNSKSDISTPTILLFEEASATDINLLGYELSTNLNIIADDLGNETPSLKLTYTNKDVLLYLSLNDLRRTINFTTAAKKTNPSLTEGVNFSTGYIIEGDSIILDSPLSISIFETSLSIKGIKFNTLTDGSLNVCADPIATHVYNGITAANDAVTLEPSLVDGNGKSFATLTDFYVSSIGDISNNGVSAGAQVAQDIQGARAMQLYYNYDLGGTPFYAMGFVIVNTDGTTTFALRQFTPVLTGNNIVFNFAPTISVFGNPDTDANIDNVNIYLNALTEGGTTYVFEYEEGLYEFYNPCTGWTVELQAVL